MQTGNPVILVKRKFDYDDGGGDDDDDDDDDEDDDDDNDDDVRCNTVCYAWLPDKVRYLKGVVHTSAGLCRGHRDERGCALA